MARKFDVHVTESIILRDSLSMKHKRPGKKKPIAESFSGSERRKSVGDYVNKERLIDRENDRYKERVVTEDGEVLRNVDEPLSAHHGRGSAKLKGPSKTK